MSIKLLDYVKKINCKKLNIQKMDIVYTFVDSTDKNWLKKIKNFIPNKNIDPQRYKDYGEIYFSLKTLEKYGKDTFNNIYIVTDNQKIDESKISDWLKKKIIYIFHKDIIPKQFLPTFNSITIESFLHNIPNISKNFIYINDDMFIGNYIKPSFFYNKNGCMNIYVKQIKKASNRSNNKPWLDYYLNVYDLFINKYNIFPDFAPSHTYYSMNVDICNEVWNIFGDELNNSITRIRNKKNINFWFLCFAMGLYKGIFTNKTPKMYESLNITCHPNMTENNKIKDMQLIFKNRPYFFCYNNINKDCEKYWNIVKNTYIQNNNVKVVSLNILAHQYTNFTKGELNKKETNNDLKLRYIKLFKVLSSLDADIYCLQEVDQIASRFLKEKFFNLGYNEYYVYNDKNNGLLILSRMSYKVITKFKRNITNNYYHKKDISYPHKKQIAQYVILGIDNKKLLIVNTRLWGHPDRIDVRKDEINNILKNIKENNKNIFICGDFNETNYIEINNVFKNKLYVYDKYFKNNNFATSYHPWNLNRLTKKMYKEPKEHKYKNVDYFVYSPSIKITKFKSLPTNKGILNVEEPYKDKNSIFTMDKWMSDHALLIFDIKIL